MLIESDAMTDVKVGKGYVMGIAKGDDGLLWEKELVFMAEGVSTFIRTVLKEFPTPKREGASSDYDYGFHTFSSWEECVDVYLNNPQSLVDYIPTELHPTDPNEQGRELEYDVTGDFIDMGRHMEGIPESFGRLTQGNPRSRRVRIYVDTSNPGSLSSSSIVERSRRIVRLIDALEGTGVRCELAIIRSGQTSHIECIVKRYDESLVLEDVAVATHPDFQRRIMFRVSEWSDTWYSGYGAPTHLRGYLDSLKSKMNDELTIFVHNGMSRNIDGAFDQLEQKIVEEISEAVPAISLMEVNDRGVETVAL